MLLLQNNHSNYRVEIPTTYVRGHEPPDMIVIRGQVYLDEEEKCSVEPFTEGMSAGDSVELVQDPLNRESKEIYATLKAHEGKMVSIRFLKGNDGTAYGFCEATLQLVTHHFVKLYDQGVSIQIFDGGAPIKTPESTKTIALSFIRYEEDDEKENRPRLVIDYSHWEPRL